MKRPVKGYEGYYEVSDSGDVYRIGKQNKLMPHEYCGYLYVELSKQGYSKKYRVHRLVAEAFIDNPNKLPQVNHKDENKHNNNASNLEWCTAKYNSSYGTRSKRANITKGCRRFRCEETGIIYESQAECARELNINAGNLNSVLHNRGCRNSISGYHFEFC